MRATSPNFDEGPQLGVICNGPGAHATPRILVISPCFINYFGLLYTVDSFLTPQSVVPQLR